MNRTQLTGVGILLVAALSAEACGEDEASTPLPPPGPPELTELSVSVPSGEPWTPGDPLPIELDCGNRIVIGVGPNPVPGTLVNWTLRPPHACGATPNCGYVVASLLGADGTTVIDRVEGAQTSLLFDLSDAKPEDARLLRVALHDGSSGDPFVVADGGIAQIEAAIEFATATGCVSGDAGAGGQGGAGAGGDAGQGGTAGSGGSGGGASGGSAGDGGASGAPGQGGDGGQGGA